MLKGRALKEVLRGLRIKKNVKYNLIAQVSGSLRETLFVDLNQGRIYVSPGGCCLSLNFKK
jgi:hypothetical protein